MPDRKDESPAERKIREALKREALKKVPPGKPIPPPKTPKKGKSK